MNRQEERRSARPVRIICACLLVGLFCLAEAGCAGQPVRPAPDNEKRAMAMENLGMALVRQGRLRAGLEKLLEAARLEPKNADVHHEIAVVYRNLGKYQEALRHFQRALALRPRFPEAWNNLGTLYLILKDWNRAVSAFRKAADDTLYETPYIAYNNLGLAYFRMGDYRQAISHYRQALRLLPSYSRCYRNLGLAYEALHRWERAVKAYEKAVFYAPGYAAAYVNLGRIYIRLHRPREAAAALRKAMDVDQEGGPIADEAERLLKDLQ